MLSNIGEHNPWPLTQARANDDKSSHMECDLHEEASQEHVNTLFLVYSMMYIIEDPGFFLRNVSASCDAVLMVKICPGEP